MMASADAITLRGGCHCGALRVEFRAALPLPNRVPRACDCSFCRRHGAAWLSDPHGSLRIEQHGRAAIRYRQGSDSADFLLCGACGVLVAVVFEHEGRCFGAANAGCLDEAARLAPAVAVSPQRLDAAAKAARWRQLWVPDVVVLDVDSGREC